MALNEQRLEEKIFDVFGLVKEETDNSEQSRRTLAREIAKAVIEEVKEGDVLGVCPSGGGALTQGKMI